MPKGIFKHHKNQGFQKGSKPWNIGKTLAIKTRKKISKANKGNNNPMYGKRFYDENNPNWKGGPINKICVVCGKQFKVKRYRKQEAKYCSYKCSNQGVSLYQSGVNHWNWQGGLSFEPYSTDWTATLKRSIRERDHYVCRLCGALQGDIAFDVHHIFYNKKDCNPEHLITLCRKCHIKTNHNRNYWIKYFNDSILWK